MILISSSSLLNLVDLRSSPFVLHVGRGMLMLQKKHIPDRNHSSAHSFMLGLLHVLSSLSRWQFEGGRKKGVHPSVPSSPRAPLPSNEIWDFILDLSLSTCSRAGERESPACPIPNILPCATSNKRNWMKGKIWP